MKIRELSWEELYSDGGLVDRDFLKLITERYQFTKSSFQYYREYFNKAKPLIYSVEIKEVIVVVFLSTFQDSKISFFKFPCTLFTNPGASADVTCNAVKELLRHISNRFKELGVIELEIDGNSFLLSEYFSRIIEKKIHHSGFVNLELSPDHIKTSVRKSYKSLVNWGKKYMEIKTFDADSITEDIFAEFKDFHHKIAGKPTRSPKTWKIQLDAIKSGEAFLTSGYLEGELVACSLVLLGSREAFYGVGVYNRELMQDKKPVAHYPIYCAILEAKRRGMKYFNMDSVDFVDGNSEKQNNIAFFKKGFVSELRLEPHYLIQLT